MIALNEQVGTCSALIWFAVRLSNTILIYRFCIARRSVIYALVLSALLARH